MSLISKEHLSLTLQTIKKLLSRKADKSEISELREEIVQSDWNQNDESAKDYIKNRTHWTETTTEQKTESILLDCESSAGASEVVTVSQGFIKGLKENPDAVVVSMSIDDLERTHRIEFSNPNDSNYFSIINLITEWRDLHGYIGTNDAGESTVYVTDYNGRWTYCYIAVTYEDVVEKVHKLDSKYIPDGAFAQSDWNQNDESAIDYVKNRTHWEEPALEEIFNSGEHTVTVEDTYYDDSQFNYSFDNTTPIEFIIGETYRVSYCGTSTETIADQLYNLDWKDENGRSWEFGSQTHGPTGLLRWYGPNSGISTLPFTTTLIVERVLPNVIYKLDPKYIPDEALVRPDWNQNDETALDFVKNRTHYSKPCIIDRTFEATGSSGHTSYDLELVNLLWDNANKATYTLKRIGKEEPEIYTNPTIIELSPVSKKIELANNYYVSINKETGQFNFGEPTGNGAFLSGSIYLNTEQIIQLDEKFIPDTIARVSDIPSGENTDQSGLSAELKTALVNYYTHVTPSFDDDNGLTYINAILTALGAEIRDAI